MQPGIQWKLKTNPDDTLFIYIIDGEGRVEESGHNTLARSRAVLFNSGDEFFAAAGQEGMRFLLFSAKAIKEPVAWGGPIVMNTREELDLAFQELRNGSFIKSQ